MPSGGGFRLRLRAIHTWIRDYDNLQWLALRLIYAQIGCALVGSLGPIYNGVLLVDLGISLFALVAIESSSQSLARTYAFLLFCSICLDFSWFFIFSHHIWFFPSEFYGAFGSFLVKLTLVMQIIGFSVRLSSSLLWIQMYRLGSSYIDNSGARDTDAYLRNSFINPATPIVRVTSGCDDAIGGSIYDPAYYSSLFEPGRNDTCPSGVSQNLEFSLIEPAPTAETQQLSPDRSLHVTDDENVKRRLQVT
ncbi:membrane protein insertase YidC [Striga asiatica]|uniref:Membrane protein insertase YidC n=1 Tax=Striga asiatica TaxID=4170 RepID=A0A5A7QZ35_STRAF|nr:membrane protein insertase YidC [Striga asiatica]